MNPNDFEQEATAISRLLDDLSIRIRRIVETKCAGFTACEKDVLAKGNELLQTSSGNLHSHTCGLRHILLWPEFELPDSRTAEAFSDSQGLRDVGEEHTKNVIRVTTNAVVNKKMSLQELAAALHKSGLRADDIAKIRGED